MENNIIQLAEDRIILLDDEPQFEGDKVEFHIKFPEGALIDSLKLFGIVERCEVIRKNDQEKYLLKISLFKPNDSDLLILRSYLVYLEREKLIDQIHNSLDFNAITKNILRCKNEWCEHSAINEFLWAKINNETFH